MPAPIIQVALPSPLRRLFDYRGPAGVRAEHLPIGARVRVPFGNRQLVGLIAGIVEHSSVPAGKLKQAAELLDHQSLLPDSLWQLCRWTASYYQHGLGDTLSSALPVLLRQGEPALARQDMLWQLLPGAYPEGKGVLFKRFAGVDVFDIEVEAESPQAFIDTVKRISCTFGGINLEDIKAPECFEIERALIEQCDIPVFHDDQHGTAIVTAAAMLNALELADKKLEDAKIVCLGAGAAAVACMKLLISLGAAVENISMVDRKGVIHAGRDDLNEHKAIFANETDKRTLTDAIKGADVFVGLSGPNLLQPAELKLMAENPVVFACSNPDPEISPELAHASRPDVIMATGRSDYPNQVNNVLGFPFIFRGALDVRATRINEEMKIAAVHAIRDLAKESVPDYVMQAYGGLNLEFGREYIIPKPMDVRLIEKVPAAVARAAVDSGVARLPYPAHYPLKSVEDCV